MKKKLYESPTLKRETRRKKVLLNKGNRMEDGKDNLKKYEKKFSLKRRQRLLNGYLSPHFLGISLEKR